MRILVAGTGSIGRRHIINIQHLQPDVQFIVLRKDGRIDSFVKEIGALVVTDVEEALSKSPDCAIIATPSTLHFDLLLSLIEAGISMYIEKPVVTSRIEVERVYNALTKNNYRKTTMVGCNLRYLGSLQKTRDLILDGEIGTVVRASFQAGQWLPDWRPDQDYRKSYSSDPSRGGGVILDLIHEFDAVRWLLGEFKQVCSFAERFEPLGIESEAVACSILSNPGSVPLVCVSLDYIARSPVRRYEFIGDKGNLVWDLQQKKLIVQKQGEIKEAECGKEGFNVQNTYISSMSEYLQAVHDNNSTTQDIFEGLRSVELILLAKESTQ